MLTVELRYPPHYGATDHQPIPQELVVELDRHFSPEGLRRRRGSRLFRSGQWLLVRSSSNALRGFAHLTGTVLPLLLCSPVLLLLLLWTKASGGRLGTHLTLGRSAVPFARYSFVFGGVLPPPFWANTILADLPALFNALRGEMSLVGPRPVSPGELPASERNAWKRYDIRPGLIFPGWLRERANIAYTNESDLDVEYVETHSLVADVGIAMRALPAMVYGKVVSAAPGRVTLFGIGIANLTMAEAVDQIISLAIDARSSQVCFLNAAGVNVAFGSSEYRAVLGSCAMVLADGIGICLAGRLLHQHIRQNVNGTDAFPRLCSAAAREGLGVYLLGGRPGVAESTARWITDHHPSLKICGARHGYFTQDQEAELISDIGNSGAHMLLVGLGVPRQDEWIAANRIYLGTGVSIGVGGLFDFYSGRIPRAPIWMREIGIEWFHRFLQEPGRMWRRYLLGNAFFLFRVAVERWRLRHNGAAANVSS